MLSPLSFTLNLNPIRFLLFCFLGTIKMIVVKLCPTFSALVKEDKGFIILYKYHQFLNRPPLAVLLCHQIFRIGTQ